VLAAPPPASINTARSPAALTKTSFSVKKGFEDKVERAGRLRRP